MEQFSKTELNQVKRGPKRASYDVAQINAILDAGFMCNVGYVWQGKAIVIPTAYVRINNEIYLHGSLKNRMMLALLEAGEGSISVTHLDGLVLARSAFHHSVNYRSVNVFGSVRMVTNPAEKMHALEEFTNHVLPGRWDDVRPPNKKEFEATLFIAVRIDAASAKVRAEGVNDEKFDHDGPHWAGVVPLRTVASAPESDPELANDIPVPKSVHDYVTAMG